MNNDIGFTVSGEWINSARGAKNKLDPEMPYAWLVEKEYTHKGTVEDTGIIFLTNRECRWKCLMCDLWKNTTDYSVPPGAIPRQIKWALEKMPGVKHVKLYNSGSFFDDLAISESDYKNIAELLVNLKTVIVECHPKLVNEKCLRFRDMLKPELHIAMGLESSDAEVLSRLNKGMLPGDFSSAVNYLTVNGILSRAFILLRPPFMSEEEGIIDAQKSIGFAFASGAECCTVIPVRSGNGAVDELQRLGYFSPPDLRSLENVLEYGISLNKGRVFADTWDLELFSKCSLCFNSRKERIESINLTQKIAPHIECDCSE